MSGIKGRSGKVTSSAAKAARSEAGRRGMASRWGGGELPPVPPDLDPFADDPIRRLGRAVTWGDELKCQQVEGEKIANRKREVEVRRAEVELARAQDERDQARGKLLTRDQHREAVAAIVTAIIDASSTLTTAAVSPHPPESQPAARHQFELALAKWREAAMALIKDQGK